MLKGVHQELMAPRYHPISSWCSITNISKIKHFKHLNFSLATDFSVILLYVDFFSTGCSLLSDGDQCYFVLVCECCVWQNPSSACERGDTLLTVASWDYAKTQPPVPESSSRARADVRVPEMVIHLRTSLDPLYSIRCMFNHFSVNWSGFCKTTD